MAPRPGTPSLLRELNDRTALELLLTSGPMTRTELGVRTGLSKVTAAQLLGRLTERGLVQVTGTRSGGRGPNAAVYAVVPSTAYVAGLHVEADVVGAGIADVTGQVITEVSVDTDGGRDPVALVHDAVAAACAAAGLDAGRLSAIVIGSPGVVDPRTGDVRLAVNIPLWHEGVLDALRGDLGRTVIIENDTNLAARAEHVLGAARDTGDFALVWIGTGLGLAAVIGGRVHQGAAGAAGEIGYLPVPGVGLPENVRRPLTGSFQSLAGASGVRRLAASSGFTSESGSDVTAAAEAVAAAVALAGAQAGDGKAGGNGARARERYGTGPGDDGGAGTSRASGSTARPREPYGTRPGGSGAADVERARRFLDELAGRVALGVAAISVILDPGLVVLGGDIGLAGGTELARRVAEDVGRICPATPRVVPTGLPRGPVLRGAMLAAVETARTELLASVAAS